MRDTDFLGVNSDYPADSVIEWTTTGRDGETRRYVAAKDGQLWRVAGPNVFGDDRNGMTFESLKSKMLAWADRIWLVDSFTEL